MKEKKRHKWFLTVTVKAKRQPEMKWYRYHGIPESGYYSFVLPVYEEDDVTSILVNIVGFQRCDIYTKKREAVAAVNAQREQFTKEGMYLFSDWANWWRT